MDKPLHVQVAEIVEKHVYTLSPYVVINGARVDVPTWIPEWATPDRAPGGWYAGWQPTRYDTDWSATGPLIEKYRMIVVPGDPRGWWVTSGFSQATSENLLEAVCNLILALKAAGKL